MKKIFVLIFIQLAVHGLYAQGDTAKVEQYCQVVVTPRLLSNRVTIDIDFGEEKSFWADTRMRNYDGKLKKFNTVIDAMNFMGKEGWLFINAYPVRRGELDIYHFAFKKLFLRSEVISTRTIE